MKFIMGLLSFLEALPELIKIYKTAAAKIQKAEEDRKVKEELRKLNEAWEKNDLKAIRDNFNS